MKLSQPKAIDRQRRLFDPETLITSKGQARWAVGEFFEDATAAVSGAVRHRTSGVAEYCPDLRYDDATYFEVKGCGQSSQVILYQCRMQKDELFVREHNVALIYWLWCHKFPVLQAKTFNELGGGLSGAATQLLIVHRDVLCGIVKQMEPRVVNSGATKGGRRLGYGLKGYGTGWTVRTSVIRQQCRQLMGATNVRIGKHSIRGIDVFVSDMSYRRFVARRRKQGTLATE